MQELKGAIGQGHNTTPGRDGLGNEIFKHMNDLALEEMLASINTVWDQGHLPAEWKHAVIIPILKPGKEAVCPGSYRPPSQQSCVRLWKEWSLIGLCIG